MAVLTLLAHVSRAVSFYDKNDIYVAVGDNPDWSGTDLPPEPKPTDELVGFKVCKKVESKFLVKPDTNGSLIYGGQRWKIVPKEESFNEGARWVFLRTSLNYDEALDVTGFNQIGVLTGVVKKDSVPSGQYVLKEDDIETMGILEVLDNRKWTPRENDKYDQLTIVIEF